MRGLAAAVIVLLFTINSYATTILIYHKIGDNRTPTTNVSIKKFKEQMKYLHDNGYKVLALKKVVSMIKNHKKLPKKSVVLTFDDGYRTVYKNAFPVIKKYGYPATVFLPTEAIEKRYPDYMTLNQIKTMMKYGIDFESHSYSHPRMAYKPKNWTNKHYEEWIKGELTKSIEFFKKHFGYKPYAFAIPYGEYNKTVIDTAEKAGFKVILTQDPGSVSIYTPLYLIPREPILGKYWSTMKHFKEVLNEEYLPITKRVPDFGLIKKTPTVIGAKLMFAKNYKNCGVYVSELGWKKAKIGSNGLVLIKNTKKFKRKKDRIAITCVDKNTHKIAVNFWMIINSN